MTPGQVFLLVLFLLYLSDCFLLVPRRGFALLSVFRRGKWRVALPSEALGNDRGGLVMTMPFPPLGRAFTVGRWPISLSTKGFTGVVTSCPNPGVRPPLLSEFVSWDALKEVGWDGRILLVNGSRYLKLASPQVASEYSRLLFLLARMPEGERVEAIGKWCRRELSARRVSRRLSIFERATAGLRQTCNLLFFTAFVFVPVTYWRFGAELPFLVALAFGGVLMLWIGIDFWCLHRRLFPEQRAERLQLWLLVGFMPQYSIRAVDELSKGFLGNAHPLAVAEAVLEDDRFLRFRDDVVRDLECPVPQIFLEEVAGEAFGVADEFREKFERPAVRELVSRRLARGVETVPAQDSLENGSRLFCPRCLMPYEEGGAECLDCGGVKTLPVGSAIVAAASDLAPARADEVVRSPK